MTYFEAISLIGCPVESKNGYPYIVRDVTDERDGSHNVLLSGGQIVPLEDFDKIFTPVVRHAVP